jgi:amphi-Trp domain-containing protein
MEEIETEAECTRGEVADVLKDVAAQLDAQGDVTVDIGGQTASVEPRAPITFKMEAESDWSDGEAEAKQSLEFELVWRRAVESADEASIRPPETHGDDAEGVE